MSFGWVACWVAWLQTYLAWLGAPEVLSPGSKTIEAQEAFVVRVRGVHSLGVRRIHRGVCNRSEDALACPQSGSQRAVLSALFPESSRCGRRRACMIAHASVG